MEGDWTAVVAWDRDPGGQALRLRFGESGASLGDVSRAAAGGTSVIVGGAIAFPAGLRDAAPDSPSSPAEGLLHAFRSSGLRLLPRLRGRFAALIWDQNEGRLLAWRDPMGVYPLFAGVTAGGLSLSPSVESLLAGGEVAGAPDRVVLAEHLWHRWPDKRRTSIEAVRRVPAGHLLTASGTAESVARYWDPQAGAQGEVDWLPASELGRFDELFDRAVARCAVPGRTGLFLSGGLDSVAIADSLATGKGKGARPLALSLAFQHPDCDETAIQAAVCAARGLDHEVRDVRLSRVGRGPLGRAADLSADWPVPLMNVWNGEFHRLARRGARRGCEVIMTGSGGDDWLGVSPYYAADLLRAGRLPSLARMVESLRLSHGLSRLAAARTVVWRFGLRALARDRADRALGRGERDLGRGLRRRLRRRRLPGWLAPGTELRRRLIERESYEPAGASGGSLYVREMRRGLDHPVLSMELEESFELGRRTGVEIVHPFFDPDLVAFLYRVHPKALVGDGGPDRQLVRRRLARRFPTAGFATLRKSDARAFFADLARSEGARLWSALGGPRELAKLGIVHPRKVEEEVSRMLAGRDKTTNLFRVWDLINLETWLRGRAGRGAA